MVGIRFEYDLKEEAILQERLNKLAGLDVQKDFLGDLGALVESQTRRRLSEEKESPDGVAWVEWSDQYANTRHSGHSLLEGEGDLIDSIDNFVENNAVSIGSPLVYAAIQHAGGEEVGKDIPERPYLGLSEDNKKEISGALESFIEGALS